MAGVGSTGIRRRGERGVAPTIVLAGVTVAVTTALVATTAGGDGSVAAALAVGALVPAAVWDVRERRLPDRLVGVGALVLLVATAAIGSIAVTELATGALVLAAPILLLHLVSPAGMGFGDVKLAIVLGAAVGTEDWRLALAVLCLASAMGTLLGLLRHTGTVAFGALLVVASAVVVAVAPHLDVLSGVAR